MLQLERMGTKHFSFEESSCLFIQYYLTQSDISNRQVYGICIQSYREDTPSSIHSEIIFNLSHSKSYAALLVNQCIKHAVTPSDLISAIDLLMDNLYL